MRSEIEETDSGYLVSIPIASGLIRLAFEEIEQIRSHEISADLTIWQEIPGVPTEPFSARINILSLNGREAYRRNVDDAFGKGGWTAVLNRACAMVRNAWQTKERALVLGGLQIRGNGTAGYLFKPLICDSGVTILFGYGATGKSYLALALARAVAESAPFLGEQPAERAVLYIDYEDSAETQAYRLRRLKFGNPGLPENLWYWPSRGIPLADQIIGIGRKAKAADIGLVIVDSAALACGGDPSDSTPTLRLFGSLESLRIPVLMIAHVNKAEDERWPYGSVFWQNCARMTWNVKADHSEDEETMWLGLFNRKANGDKPQKPIGVRISFLTDEVVMNRFNAEDRFLHNMSLPVRVRWALGNGPRTVRQLGEELGVRTDQVRVALHRMKDKVQSRGYGGDGSIRWELREYRDTSRWIEDADD